MNKAILIKKFHTLLGVTNQKEHKASILAGFGAGSTNELTVDQLSALCNTLEHQVSVRHTVSDDVRKKRSIVLSLLDDLGIKGKGKDWTAVNNYLSDPRVSGKVLYEMDAEELSACAIKLRVIKKWREDKRAKNDYLSKNN